MNRKFCQGLFALAALIANPSYAVPNTCYELSRDGVVWSRTPETLCIETISVPVGSTDPTGPTQEKSQLTLTIEDMMRPQVVATFILDDIPVLGAARVFGIANPENSLFNDLEISVRFAAVDDNTHGHVLIGDNEFFYRVRN